MDVMVQAGPFDPVDADPSPATAQGEKPPQQAQGVAECPGIGVRAEITGPVILDPSDDQQLRIIFLPGHLEQRVLLVVAELDIVFRVILFDQVGLEGQRLNLRRGDDELEPVDLTDHELYPGIEGTCFLKVRTDPVPEGTGLADVEHLVLNPAHQVDAGLGR